MTVITFGAMSETSSLVNVTVVSSQIVCTRQILSKNIALPQCLGFLKVHVAN